MSNALTTKARVKDRLKITTTNFDTLIDNLIVAVTARLETMCGRQFTLATYTNELHDGSDFLGSSRSILIPKNAPIASVASIQYKSGTNATPNWTTFSTDDYDVDEATGLIYFDSPLPRGKRNLRITYTAGWDGYDVSTSNLWSFGITPTGTVDGANGVFTLPENAAELLVYADGVRIVGSNITFTVDTATFTIAATAVPYSTIEVDYKATPADSGSSSTLPPELVDVCERAVAYLFKRRDAEGKTSEAFQESSITWRSTMFSAEDLATIKNYRRGYHL